MAEYNNALSDRLIVAKLPTSLVYLVYRKDNTLKWSTTALSLEPFPSQLDGCIFSGTSVIRLLDDITLAPLGLTEYRSFHMLNFGDVERNLTHVDSEDFALVYPTSDDTEWYSHLIRPSVYLDIDLLHTFVQRKGHEDALYFYLIGDKLTILAWKEGVFQITNRYTAENDDEIFYYVMLIVEQMELVADKLHFSTLGDKDSHYRWHKLFANYLSPLHLIGDSTGASTDGPIIDFFVQCVL